MNEEIKEILEDIKEIYYFKPLLDYITNLQEENEDYKSRNEKAIKYNYELQERYCHSALFDNLVASKIYEITEKQLNILNDGDNNE